MSLGIFESTMAYLETIFEFFDFGHSKPLFQLQNEVVSTIPGLKMSKMGVCKGISKHWVDFNDLERFRKSDWLTCNIVDVYSVWGTVYSVWGTLDCFIFEQLAPQRFCLGAS